MVQALGARCWNRALRGLELPKALSDCDAALRLTGRSNPLALAILNGRGLVQLRMTEYDKSIADYDDALKLAPKNASVLYGRGIDKLRKKKTAEGNADLAAATALSAPIADQFKLHGIVP
jgi:tetratricopeptide (TPR) repeat protein